MLVEVLPNLRRVARRPELHRPMESIDVGQPTRWMRKAKVITLPLIPSEESEVASASASLLLGLFRPCAFSLLEQRACAPKLVKVEVVTLCKEDALTRRRRLQIERCPMHEVVARPLVETFS